MSSQTKNRIFTSSIVHTGTLISKLILISSIWFFFSFWQSSLHQRNNSNYFCCLWLILATLAMLLLGSTKGKIWLQNLESCSFNCKTKHAIQFCKALVMNLQSITYTLDFLINVPVHLLIFEQFSHQYALIRTSTFILHEQLVILFFCIWPIFIRNYILEPMILQQYVSLDQYVYWF